MRKLRQFKFPFVYFQINPAGLILGNILFWKHIILKTYYLETYFFWTRLVALISM